MIKLGMALGGGGARGSYQLGVIKALLEEGLLDDLKVISGTSIGSFNACLVMEKLSFEEMYDIWSEINNDVLYKHAIDGFKTNRLGLFDQTKMYEILKTKSNPLEIVKSDIKGYVAACDIGPNGLFNQLNRKHMRSVLLHLNESRDPHRMVLASSSIPIIFGATEIDGTYYVDGGMLNMLPIDALEKEECNLMIVVGLSKNNKISQNNPDSLIIDFSPKNNISQTPIGILDFSKENLTDRITMGYETAKEIIADLKTDGIINNGKWSLSESGIYSKKELLE